MVFSVPHKQLSFDCPCLLFKMQFGYWYIQGVGEPCRWLIAAADLKDVEQVELGKSDDGTPNFASWTEGKRPEVATKSFFPNLPYLIVKEGEVAITQSRAILAFLGKKGGYSPVGDAEELRTDIVNGVIDDIWLKFMGRLMYSGPAYEESKQKIHDELVPKFQELDSYLDKHKFATGNRAPTWLDFKILHYLNITLRFSKVWASDNNLKYVENLKAYLSDKGSFKEVFEKSCASRPFTPPGFAAWKLGGGPPNDMKPEFE